MKNSSPASLASPADKWLTTPRFLLLLTAALLAAFPKVILGMDTFFYRDFGALGYPGGYYFRESFLRGEIPLWNPYSHCGMPFMAQWGMWYPASFLCLILPMPWAVNITIFLHLFFGGWGMYWLVRRWGVGGFAAGFAGFAFVFNGVTMSCLAWGNYIASLALLPWVVGCVMETWRNGGRWIPLAAFASAMQVLTATPELTFLTWMFLAAVWLGKIVSGKIPFTSSALRTAGVILLAAGITMMQMLPFFDLLAHSQRDSNYGTQSWAMPGWGWANLLVPLFHCYRSPQGTWFQMGQEFIGSYYLGVSVMVLGVLGIWMNHGRQKFVIAGTILVCWIMALGSEGFLYDWIRKIFPMIGIARFPVKFAILPAFLLPLIVAFTVDKIIRNRHENVPRRLAIIAAAALLLMGALVLFAWKFPFTYDNWNATALNAAVRAGLMLVVLGGIFSLTKLKSSSAKLAAQVFIFAALVFDAVTHSPQIAPTLPNSVLAPGFWQLGAKSSPPKLGEGRIMISPDAEQRLQFSRVADQEKDFLGKRLAEWYNLNLLDGIPKVTGAFTLRPAHFDKIEQYLYYTTGADYGQGLLDFVSAAWFSAPDNPVQWSPRANFLPVITAGQKPMFADDEMTLWAITATNFNPRAMVCLPESARATVIVSNRTDSIVRDVKFGAKKIEATVETAQPALVVLSQTFYHLWEASIGDKPVEILRANLAFQAIQVPAGTHHIKLVYRDPNLVTGAIISILSLAACALIWFRAERNAEHRLGKND